MLYEYVFKCSVELEYKLNRLLRTFEDKLTEDIYNFLFSSGSTNGILYELPKNHKSGLPS